MNNQAGRPRKVSQAPEPTKPLNPQLRLPPPDPIPEPDWTKWSHMRAMRLWQAVALLVPLSPEHLPVYPEAHMLGMDPFRITPPTFNKLLEVAASNAGAAFAIEADSMLPSVAFGMVDAVAVGQWALRSGVVQILPAAFPVQGTCPDSGTTEESLQAAENCASAPPAAPAAPPIPTPEVADAFAFADIARSLGDVNNHKWLIPARVNPGKPPRAATWNPITLALLLMKRKGLAEHLFRSAFQTKPVLQPWLAAWNEAEQRKAWTGKA